ncbi:MAG TPA: glutathionylspermidine synthase family protein [Anaerovoracaceae bacterium]|nr:glutathionylspermidine synthase family protein [Anaerovoracaceae bacterium]
MKRLTTTPRKDWQKIVEKQGLLYHTIDGVPYWDESVYYSFTMDQVDEIEKATGELHTMALAAAQNIIDNKRYAQLQIPDFIIPLIEKTWNEEPPALYGRFDFSYDGKNPPKMLEYNADTPTSLLEASVIQWYWMEDKFNKDQFNSIHDKLIAKFKSLKEYLYPGPVYFTAQDTWEDYMTIQYLRDCAEQSGLKIFGNKLTTESIRLEDVGWDSKDKVFIDMDFKQIKNIFKLYPWEWMIHEEFGQHLLECTDMFWMEPAWKMLLSNKGILPVMWELYPNHPNLLEAYFDKPAHFARYAKKPLLSREGANVKLVTAQDTYRTPGEYGEEGYVYQQLAMLPNCDGKYPVIGSWMIDQEPAGMGIRESDGPITDNFSRFVPHIIDGCCR